MIVVNFKNYAVGRSALMISKKIERHLPKSTVCVSNGDLSLISLNSRLRVYSQSIDAFEGKRNTGFLIPESVKFIGAKGVLINHSEHRISFRDIKKLIELCKKYELETLVCASSLREVRKMKKLKPYAIAFEIPSLISTGKSITKYNGKEVVRFINILKGSGIKSLCGAGISSKNDVKRAYEFGCDGVFISSAISKFERGKINKVEKFLKELRDIENERRNEKRTRKGD